MAAPRREELLPILNTVLVVPINRLHILKPVLEPSLSEQVDVVPHRGEVRISIEAVHCPLVLSFIALVESVGDRRACGHGEVADRQGRVCSEGAGCFGSCLVSDVGTVAAVVVGDTNGPRDVVYDTAYS